MDAIDKLLANLNANSDNPAVPATPPAAMPNHSPDPTPTPNSLDDLLAQLADETKQSVRAHLSKQVPAANPIAPSPTTPADLNFMDSLARSPEATLLAQLKSEYAERDRAAAQQHQQQLQAAERQRQQQEHEKQHRLEQLRQQRRAELAKQAEAWLNQLDRHSDEGLWFEEFACGYESLLEAAIDYLEALQAAKRSP
jgi:septal ring factor EnvC (AmiA/AmiB activator)